MTATVTKPWLVTVPINFISVELHGDDEDGTLVRVPASDWFQNDDGYPVFRFGHPLVDIVAYAIVLTSICGFGLSTLTLPMTRIKVCHHDTLECTWTADVLWSTARVPPG